MFVFFPWGLKSLVPRSLSARMKPPRRTGIADLNLRYAAKKICVFAGVLVLAAIAGGALRAQEVPPPASGPMGDVFENNSNSPVYENQFSESCDSANHSSPELWTAITRRSASRVRYPPDTPSATRLEAENRFWRGSLQKLLRLLPAAARGNDGSGDRDPHEWGRGGDCAQ